MFVLVNIDEVVLTAITEGDFDARKDDFRRVLRVGDDDDSDSTKFADDLFQSCEAKGFDCAS